MKRTSYAKRRRRILIAGLASILAVPAYFTLFPYVSLALSLISRSSREREWISALVEIDDTRWNSYALLQLEQVLEQTPALANSYNQYGYTPLGSAAKWGNLRAATILLRFGAEPSKQFVPKFETWRGEGARVTPLAIAIDYGHRDLAHLLLDAGAELGEIERATLARQNYTAMDEFLADNRHVHQNTGDTKALEMTDEERHRLWYGPDQ